MHGSFRGYKKTAIVINHTVTNQSVTTIFTETGEKLTGIPGKGDLKPSDFCRG